jgi:hypothetical protein
MLRRDGRRRRLRRCKLIFKLISEAKKQRKQNDDDQTHRKLSRALASVYCDARLLGKLIARAGQHGERLKTYSTLRRALASVYRCPLFIVMMVTLGNSTASLRRQHIRADENDVARPWTRECVSADALHSKHSRPCYVVIHELGVMHAYTHTHTHTHCCTCACVHPLTQQQYTLLRAPQLASWPEGQAIHLSSHHALSWSMPMGSVPLARLEASNSLCMTLGSTGVYLTSRGPPAPPSLPSGAVHANNTVASTSEEASCSMAGRGCVAPAALRATRTGGCVRDCDSPSSKVVGSKYFIENKFDIIPNDVEM